MNLDHAVKPFDAEAHTREILVKVVHEHAEDNRNLRIDLSSAYARISELELTLDDLLVACMHAFGMEATAIPPDCKVGRQIIQSRAILAKGN
jgi:hypothetical protein